MLQKSVSKACQSTLMLPGMSQRASVFINSLKSQQKPLILAKANSILLEAATKCMFSSDLSPEDGHSEIIPVYKTGLNSRVIFLDVQ